MIVFYRSSQGDFLLRVGRFAQKLLWRRVAAFLAGALLLVPGAGAGDRIPPRLVFNPISVRLDSTGCHTLTSAEVARIAAGSSDASGITNVTVAPDQFGFCDVGSQMVALTLTDGDGNSTNTLGPIQVLPPALAPRVVYVDPGYPSHCALVGFPSGAPDPSHFVGFDAFNCLQAAADQVGENGVVYVAAGTYAENLVLTKPLQMVGPNAGVPGTVANRKLEARIIPARSDPENTPIISVQSDGVIVDGLFLDGNNPVLAGGYDANGVRVHAAAGVQNGVYPDLWDVEGITIRNCIITNISYDGICLDRYPYFATSSDWNYIHDNKLVNMWEGILTYALDSVIANNVITNVTHGLSVHCVETPAAKGFQPLVASNLLTIAQWWPVEIDVARAPGIWINYRRGRAAPLDVVGNVVSTPAAPGPLQTVIGLYALTVDGDGKINFINNTVNGAGNCSMGVLAANCWSNSAVQVLQCSLNNIRDSGALADTLDAKWGAGNCFLTVSNTEITLSSGGFGVVAFQEPATPACAASVEVIGNCWISGGACGVEVRGTNATASVLGNSRGISGNQVGIYVNAGRVLLEANTLTNNTRAAVWVEKDGMVDAGDCSGANVTGLATGSGPHGASAGLNDFSSYGLNARPPWAITNAGSLPVTADRNKFNTSAGETFEDAIAGPVSFSASDILAVSAPPRVEVQCLGEIPRPASTLGEFVSLGGSVTALAEVTLAAHDAIRTNRPGQYTVTRYYTLSGGCGPAVSCTQIITANDNQGPTLHCSDTIVQATDPGCDYATVTFTNLAADSCGELLGPWIPVSTNRFPIGTNTVIVIATDLANNSSACSFDVAVVGPPVLTLNPASRTNDLGTKAIFKVNAASPAPISYQWTRNDVPLANGGGISGSTNAELVIAAVSETDAADYNVEVSNFAGTTRSPKAHLTVLAPPGNLRIVELADDHVGLALTGPGGARFSLLTSTNLVHWSALCTNTAPYAFSHSVLTGAGCRFYRASREP